MGYKAIPLAAIAVGKVTSQLLMFITRNNFISHESRILDLEANTAVLPPGFILEYAGTSAPTGFLICDGSAVSQVTYADLFAVIGIAYGNPGGGNFNLPDSRGRSHLGKGTGSGLSARTLADTGGAETHVLGAAEMATHSHQETDNAHKHGNVGKGIGVGTANRQHNTLFGVASTPSGQTVLTNTGITLDNAGGGDAHNNLHPVLTLNFIIKT